MAPYFHLGIIMLERAEWEQNGKSYRIVRRKFIENKYYGIDEVQKIEHNYSVLQEKITNFWEKIWFMTSWKDVDRESIPESVIKDLELGKLPNWETRLKCDTIIS